jgi:hypothetical protein
VGLNRIKRAVQRFYAGAAAPYQERVKQELQAEIRSGFDRLDAFLRPEDPGLPKEYAQWREFYAQRALHYPTILKELADRTDSYSEVYRAGGYHYDPKWARNWILNETTLANYRGTCLDIGSGDGFWTWVLSEWFRVTGIEPVEGAVELSNAIRARLPLPIQKRTEFLLGDALEVNGVYDVVFCRAPSFFNYPIYKSFSRDLFDYDRARLIAVWRENGNSPAEIEAKLAAYPAPTLKLDGPEPVEPYANNWRKYLEKMLSLTRDMFIFILSTKPNYYGVYIGDTYNHDPAEVGRLFAEYGHSRVRMDSTDTWIVGEIYKS